MYRYIYHVYVYVYMYIYIYIYEMESCSPIKRNKLHEMNMNFKNSF